jgi:ABC-2 type transport system permease protein
MSIRGVFTALVYREVAWLKRFIGDYVTIWLLPSVYGLGIVFLPTLMSDIDFVLQRFSTLFNHPMGLTDALVLSLSLSAILTVVAVTVGDVVQTLYAEFKVYGSFTIILETVSVSAYVLATSFMRPLIMTVLSTLYLIPALSILLGPAGLYLYFQLLTALTLSSLVLGVLSGITGILIVFYTNVKRPWSVSSTIVPIMLSGAGVYIPIHLVPLILKTISSITPVPYTVELIQLIVLKGFSLEVSTPLVIIAMLFTAYYLTAFGISKNADVRVRKS